MIKQLIKLFKKLFKKEDLNYSFTPFNFPEPLKEDMERFYLEGVSKKDISARNKLIEHNMRLVVFIAKKFEGPKLMLEDLISIGSLGLIKGIESFKLDKNIKLATYCSRCIENEILMFLRKTQKLKLEVSLDNALSADGEGNELVLADIIGTNENEIMDNILNKEKRQILYESIKKLTCREQEIISLRFGLYNYDEMTQKEVATFLGISQSYISRLEKKTIDKLKEIVDERMSIKQA